MRARQTEHEVLFLVGRRDVDPEAGRVGLRGRVRRTIRSGGFAAGHSEQEAGQGKEAESHWGKFNGMHALQLPDSALSSTP